MVETKNLYQKLLAITEEIGKIEKTGKNTQQGYAFIEQAQIVAELRPQLAKHGVMIIPETISRTMEQITNKNGTVFIQANVISRYTLVNADDPKESMICEWDGGEALDTSDKATNKAMTASHKSFLMKLFNISDKEDPDAVTHEVDTAKPKLEKPGDYNHDLEKLKIQARTLMSEHGYVKEKAGEFLQTVISKDRPVTKQDYTDIIAALEA